jgi:uncharacterized damage-inducible protein DinB
MRTTTTRIFIVGLAIAGAASAASAREPSPNTVPEILDRQLSWLERDMVAAAEAMPEDKYDFVPTQGEFKGVRTFGQEVKHVAQINFVYFASLLGEKLPPDVDPNAHEGPAAMKKKSDIVQFLKASFALGHRAMRGLSAATLTDKITGTGWVTGVGWARLDAAIVTIKHSYDHYGQMVEYLRMNGIVPPASRDRK